MPEWASLQVFLTAHLSNTRKKCFELLGKWSENRKVFIKNLFILLFWLYLIVTLTCLKFLSVLESSPLKWWRMDMFTFPRARGMNNLLRERCLIKFDEEKSVLTFYRRQSVFVRRYQLRNRCLCIPRHTRCTDNQASACVCIQFFFCIKWRLCAYWINVRVTMRKTCQSGWWVCGRMLRIYSRVV